MTTLAVSKDTRDEVRQTQRELAAAERRKITTDDLLRMALRALRQITSAPSPTSGTAAGRVVP